MIQDIGPPRKEGLASCLCAPSAAYSLVGSLFPSPFCPLYEFQMMVYRDGCIAEENTRFLSFGESAVSFGAIKVSLPLQSDASLRKDKCVPYSALRDFPSCRGIMLLSPVLNLLPRVKNLILV